MNRIYGNTNLPMIQRFQGDTFYIDTITIFIRKIFDSNTIFIFNLNREPFTKVFFNQFQSTKEELTSALKKNKLHEA